MIESAEPAVEPESVGLDSGAIERLLSALEDATREDQMHGAVVVLARRGKIACHAAVGLTDRERGRPANTSDRFFLASVSKSLTAAAALILIDRGKLSFDTRIADVIPDFAVRGKQRVEVYHLLTHTGGVWPGFLPPPPLQWGPVMGDLAAHVAGIAAQALTAFPGKHVVYNPFADFSVLGEVLHRVDGRPFRDLLREEIFEPLGMTNSSFGLATDHPDRVPLRMADLSHGAAAVEVMHSLNDIIDETAELPGGGGFATAEDLFRFAEMLRLKGTLGDTRLISSPLVEYAVRNHTGDKVNDFWDFNKESRDIADFPANFMLCGGYARGEGQHHLTPLGYTASRSSFGAVGSGSTMWMVDPERELTFVFLCAGLMEGLGHFQRLRRLSDLALSAVTS